MTSHQAQAYRPKEQAYPNGICTCTLAASWVPAPAGVLPLSQSSTMDLLTVAGGRVLMVSKLLRLLSVELVGDPAADGLVMLNTDKS